MKSKKKKKQSVKFEATTTKSFDIVRLDWYDHFSGNYQWSHIDDLDTVPRICTAIGAKVRESKDTITVVANLTDNMRVADATTVLKSCLVKEVKLGTIEYGKKT